MIIGFSSYPKIEVRLPVGNGNQSLIHIIASIRDKRDCVKEFNLSSVIVTIGDSQELTNLIENIQNSNNEMNNNPFIRILSSGNQNQVDQIIRSLSQQFNQINSQSQQNAIESQFILHTNISFHLIFYSLKDGISAVDILVSPLNTRPSQSSVSDHRYSSSLLFDLIK